MPRLETVVASIWTLRQTAVRVSADSGVAIVEEREGMTGSTARFSVLLKMRCQILAIETTIVNQLDIITIIRRV
jgi:hypothetical protein